MKRYQLLSILFFISVIVFCGCKDDEEDNKEKSPKFENKEYLLGSTDSVTVRIYASDSLKQLSYGSYYVSKNVSTVNSEEFVVNISIPQDVISEKWYFIRRNTDGTLFVKFQKDDVLSKKILVIHVETVNDGSGYFTIFVAEGIPSEPDLDPESESKSEPKPISGIRLDIVPEPFETIVYNRTLLLNGVIPVNVDNTLGDISNSTDMLRDLMLENLGGNDQDGNISFNINNDPALEMEGYELSINSTGIQLSASSKKGVFYGMQTFSQLLLSATDKQIPYLTIKDSPRFSHRGLMIDPARHFIPVDEVKKFIDIMAFYKYNHLHMHLADSEGWCVKIDGLSELNQPGIGSPLMSGEGRGLYSKEDMKGLISYAATHEIEIIPEIDIPSHNSYITSLFPKLKCGTGRQLCAGKESVLDFLDIVLSEFAEIFPSHNFHLGGDEYNIKVMKACDVCQSKMRQLAYVKEEQLLADLFENVNKLLTKHEKTPMFWHEPDIPSYPQNSTIYSWRPKLFAEALSAADEYGHKVIGSVGEYCYFDYPQGREKEPPIDNWGMPVNTLRHVYSYDPTYGFPLEQTKNLIGVEALLWNEYITSIERFFYMMYPRATAFAEVAWSTPENKDWDNFYKKLDFHYKYLTTNKGLYIKIVL